MTEGLGDHYDVLGVGHQASLEEIKRAYRRLAAQYHPDRSPGPLAARLMARINLAYAVLSDPARRSAYDQSRGPQRQRHAREQYQRYRERQAYEAQRTREQQARAERAYEQAVASADAATPAREGERVSLEEQEQGTKFVVALSLLLGMVSCVFGGPVIGILVAVFGPAILAALAYAGPTLGRLLGVLFLLLLGLVAFAALVLYLVLR